MQTAVITGANSGIGNALARILVKERYRVIALDAEIGDAIKELGCDFVRLNVTSPDDIQGFKEKLGDLTVDILLNVAGVAAPAAADSLTTVDFSTLQHTFAVNTFGPLLLTQALLPCLLRAKHPRIAVVSSRMGSIADNASGGMYAYRASKAGVNAIFKSMGVDLKEKGVAVFVLHPGIVKTNLDQRWKEDGWGDDLNAVTPEVAASDLWRVLMGKGLESTGRFFHRNGEELPW